MVVVCVPIYARWYVLLVSYQFERNDVQWEKENQGYASTCYFMRMILQVWLLYWLFLNLEFKVAKKRSHLALNLFDLDVPLVHAFINKPLFLKVILL